MEPTYVFDEFHHIFETIGLCALMQVDPIDHPLQIGQCVVFAFENLQVLLTVSLRSSH